jgi:protoporphyrinogen oxidase
MDNETLILGGGLAGLGAGWALTQAGWRVQVLESGDPVGGLARTVTRARERATDQTWIYFPGKDIAFGRLHEPTNWSAAMAPPGRTLLVTEHFCFRDDATWNASDTELIETTVHHLEKLGFIRRHEARDGMVVRIPAAYPLFEADYRKRSQILCDYLARFDNLQVAGRGGLFRCYNTDQAIASGLAAAEALLRRDAEMRAAVAVGGAS